MAGMLPGVECARRRRIHQGGDSLAGLRRSSFCLYTTAHDTHLNANSSAIRTVSLNKKLQVEIAAAARDAKARLDDRLTRSTHQPTVVETQHRSATKKRTAISKYLNKLVGVKWISEPSPSAPEKETAAAAEECAVCLEEFALGGVELVRLPCSHRFHWACVAPWLESSSRCPCCRTAVISAA